MTHRPGGGWEREPPISEHFRTFPNILRGTTAPGRGGGESTHHFRTFPNISEHFKGTHRPGGGVGDGAPPHFRTFPNISEHFAGNYSPGEGWGRPPQFRTFSEHFPNGLQETRRRLWGAGAAVNAACMCEPVPADLRNFAPLPVLSETLGWGSRISHGESSERRRCKEGSLETGRLDDNLPPALDKRWRSRCAREGCASEEQFPM